MFCKATAIPSLFSMHSSSRCASVCQLYEGWVSDPTFQSKNQNCCCKNLSHLQECFIPSPFHIAYHSAHTNTAKKKKKGSGNIQRSTVPFQIKQWIDKAISKRLQFSRQYTWSYWRPQQKFLTLLNFMMAELTLNLSDPRLCSLVWSTEECVVVASNIFHAGHQNSAEGPRITTWWYL